ncbi:MAG: hypothetical protein RLY43_864 [Bacteroidota bacterium]|jgi:hypothetical protein
MNKTFIFKRLIEKLILFKSLKKAIFLTRWV